jgi:hypothetical protein
VAGAAALGMALATAADKPAEKQDHVHLKMTLVVPPTPSRAAGDVLGVYAAEVLLCPADQASLGLRDGLSARLGRFGDMLGNVLGDFLVSPAFANHRDHFDRPGAKIVSQRVALDLPGKFSLGAVVVPSGSYCHIRLTLTRLPSVSQPTILSALETSVRVARPGALPAMALTYAVPLELPFAKAWRASHGAAELTVTLDTAAADATLADASLSEGALVRLVTARWASQSKVVLVQKR